jgi:hypothetical protein
VVAAGRRFCYSVRRGVAVEEVVGHDEIVASLAAYAEGTLEPARTRAVQLHLAGGCPSCVGALFAAPVGLARPATEEGARAGRSSAWAIAGGLAFLVAVAVGSGAVVRERELRTRSVAETLARVREATEIAADLRDRLLVAKTTLRLQRRVADAEQEVLARGADEAEQEAATLREQLRAGQRRLANLEAELAGGWLANDAIAGEGLELRALRPAAPFRSVRGHVLWRPADGQMVVYVFGLPAVPPDVAYEARVIIGPGRTLSSRLRRRADGRAFAYITLPRDGAAVYSVEVRRTSDALRLLIADAQP